MSFSQDVKKELLDKLSKLESQNNMNINSERFGEYITGPIDKDYMISQFKVYMNIAKLDEKIIKSILKGVYLASGCIVNPNIDYHLEISLKSVIGLNYLIKLLEVLDFAPRHVKRKISSNSYIYIIYIKESEQISKFLTLIEAYNAVLLFEQTRVEKDVKNNINRAINCETANLIKTINTSYEQVQAINKLISNGKFSHLDDKLKYVANLRLENKDLSLNGLAKLTLGDQNLSKSGIKHRLDRIIEIAKNS